MYRDTVLYRDCTALKIRDTVFQVHCTSLELYSNHYYNNAEYIWQTKCPTKTYQKSLPYHTVKNFGELIGIQNMFGWENISKLSIYTEGNQGKTNGWWIKLWRIGQWSLNSPKILPHGIPFQSTNLLPSSIFLPNGCRWKLSQPLQWYTIDSLLQDNNTSH